MNRTKSKTKTSQKKSKKRNTQNYRMTLYEFITQIIPSEKNMFYEEVYQKYIERLKITNILFALRIKDFEKALQEKDGLEMVLYIFKRIVPTLLYEDTAVFVLLRDGVRDAYSNNGLDKLCTFLQIAGFRWALIEKSFLNSAKSRNRREGNKWIKTKEGILLSHLFENAYKKAKGIYKVESFNDIYLASIIPEIVKKEDVLFSHYRNMIKSYKQAINGIKNALNEENKADKIKDELNHKKEELQTLLKERDKIEKIYYDGLNEDSLKYLIKFYKGEDNIHKKEESSVLCYALQKHFQDEYRDYCKSQNEEIIYFKSVKRSFYLSELEETVWKKLDPWSIEECLERYCLSPLQISEFTAQKKESLDYLKCENLIIDNNSNKSPTN